MAAISVEKLLEIDPGSLSTADGRMAIAESLASSIRPGLPTIMQQALQLPELAEQVRSALSKMATATTLSAALGVGVAVVAAIRAAAAAFAGELQKSWRDEWDRQLERLDDNLIGRAQGKLLAPYQPWANITGRPPDKSLVVGADSIAPIGCCRLPRGLRPAAVASFLAWAPVTSERLPYVPFGGIYPGSKRPEVKVWDADWIGQAIMSADLEGPPAAMIVSAAELEPRPPLGARWICAPGLAPFFGPSGEAAPCGPKMLAYAALMAEQPPSDLDEVVKIVAATKSLARPRLVDALRLLLWARESRRRKLGMTPNANYLGPLRPGKSGMTTTGADLPEKTAHKANVENENELPPIVLLAETRPRAARWPWLVGGATLTGAAAVVATRTGRLR